MQRSTCLVKRAKKEKDKGGKKGDRKRREKKREKRRKEKEREGAGMPGVAASATPVSHRLFYSQKGVALDLGTKPPAIMSVEHAVPHPLADAGPGHLKTCIGDHWTRYACPTKLQSFIY